MKIAPRSAAYLALLVALSSFGPLTMSIYTPIMPLIGVDLHAGSDTVKYTLTTYMLGFAVGQLFYGPLSDRFGRRLMAFALGETNRFRSEQVDLGSLTRGSGQMLKDRHFSATC